MRFWHRNISYFSVNMKMMFMDIIYVFCRWQSVLTVYYFVATDPLKLITGHSMRLRHQTWSLLQRSESRLKVCSNNVFNLRLCLLCFITIRKSIMYCVYYVFTSVVLFLIFYCQVILNICCQFALISNDST